MTNNTSRNTGRRIPVPREQLPAGVVCALSPGGTLTDADRQAIREFSEFLLERKRRLLDVVERALAGEQLSDADRQVLAEVPGGGLNITLVRRCRCGRPIYPVPGPGNRWHHVETRQRSCPGTREYGQPA